MLIQKWTIDPWRLNYAWCHSQEKEDGKERIKRLTVIFYFFWSQFIFLWAKRSLPQGWCKAAFPGSHIYHTKEKHRKGDSMINTWFQDSRIECPEIRIRIYLPEAWDLAQVIFSAKFASKHPIYSLVKDIRYINYMILHHILKRFIELSSDLGHTCKLFVLVMAGFAVSLPLTQSHRSTLSQVRSPARDSMNLLIKVRLSMLKANPRFWDQNDLGLNSKCKLNVVWP